MDCMEKIIDAGQKISSVQEFCEFSELFHKTINCHQEKCEIKDYIEALRPVVFDPNQDYDDSKNFFIRHSVKYFRIFTSIFKVKAKGDKDLKNLTSNLKKLTEDQRQKEKDLLIGLLEQKSKIEKKKKRKKIDVILANICAHSSSPKQVDIAANSSSQEELE